MDILKITRMEDPPIFLALNVGEKMICKHPMIISVIVKHWGGTWIEYRCCMCGTGIDMKKVKGK